MNSRRLATLGFGVVLIAIAAISWRVNRPQPATTSTAQAGDKPVLRLLSQPSPVTAFTTTDLDGKTVSSDSWRGKVTIINFWATWCPPCRAEIPDLIALQDKYRDQVQVIGISQDEIPAAQVKQFVPEQRMNYPVMMSTPAIEKIFTGIYALPTSFILDRDGQIVQKHVGMLNAATTELEARYLAGLEPNVTVERVEDETKALIRNAAQATKIPGIDLDKMTPEAKAACLKRLNEETCTCGCGLTLAACRINDPGCNISLPIAQKIAAEAEAAAPHR